MIKKGKKPKRIKEFSFHIVEYFNSTYLKFTEYQVKKVTSLHQQGLKLSEIGEDDAAIEEFHKALWIAPLDFQIKDIIKKQEYSKSAIAYTIARIHLQNKNYDDGMTYLKVATWFAPNFYLRWIARGHRAFLLSKTNDSFKPIFESNKNTKETKIHVAIKCFKKAATLDKESPEPHYYLGCCYEELDKPKQALTHFEKSLSLKADFPNIENSLMFEKIKNYAK